MELDILLLAALGGLFGYGVQRYVNRFADCFNRTLQQHYRDYYADLLLPNRLDPNYQWLPPLHNRFRLLPLGFAGVGLCLVFVGEGLLQQIWFLYCLALLLAIGLVDGYYRLISTTMCQQLLVLALFGAWQQLGLVSLAQSVQSLLIALLFVSLFFGLTSWVYRREVFGEGDCWLITALAAFFPFETLPLLLLLASGLNLLWALCKGKRNAARLELPFAPALNLSALFCFWFG